MELKTFQQISKKHKTMLVKIVLSKEKKQIGNPTDLIFRNSL